MTLARAFPRALATAAVAFAAALAVFSLDGEEPAFAPAAGGGRPATTEERIATLRAAVGSGKDDARTLALLGEAYLQNATESGEPRFYAPAERAFVRAQRADPASAAAAVGLGNVALARHDFRAGLRHGRAARRLAPQSLRPLSVIADSLIELGRYGAAERTVQRLLDLRPNVASYSRASYLRELHGDFRGAAAAMRLAIAAGAGTATGDAYVRTLLGQLEFARGRLDAARRAYIRALAVEPAYADAEIGLAEIDAARNDLPAAIARMRALVADQRAPDHFYILGEMELAAGDRAGARAHFAEARTEFRRLAAAGENVSVERAVFEADHGSAERALALARRGRASAPSVRAADALGWALTRAGRPEAGLRWAQRALAIGSRDPRFLYHAGAAAAGSGERDLARALLRGSLRANPRFSALHAQRARRVLQSLR